VVACETVQVTDHPKPDFDCPTDEDIQLLSEILPEPEDPQLAIRVNTMALRFIDAAAYCEVSAEKL
jgi:hypothetical protein